MNTNPFSTYKDSTIKLFRWGIIPITTMGQVVVVTEKVIQGPMQSSLLGLPNIVWIASSVASIWLMGWMFLGLSKEQSRRTNIRKPQQKNSTDGVPPQI